MQTFLPFGSFALSAQSLDNRRLGNQRNEAFVILMNTMGQQNGWSHHPAVKMWQGYSGALCRYGLFICREWVARGYRDTVAQKFHEALKIAKGRKDRMPWWLGDEQLHSSHRAALLFKDPDHYGKFGWPETPALSYWWPGRDQVSAMGGHIAETCSSRDQVSAM